MSYANMLAGMAARKLVKSHEQGIKKQIRLTKKKHTFEKKEAKKAEKNPNYIPLTFLQYEDKRRKLVIKKLWLKFKMWGVKKTVLGFLFGDYFKYAPMKDHEYAKWLELQKELKRVLLAIAKLDNMVLGKKIDPELLEFELEEKREAEIKRIAEEAKLKQQTKVKVNNHDKKITAAKAKVINLPTAKDNNLQFAKPETLTTTSNTQNKVEFVKPETVNETMQTANYKLEFVKPQVVETAKEQNNTTIEKPVEQKTIMNNKQLKEVNFTYEQIDYLVNQLKQDRDMTMTIKFVKSK